MVKETKYYGELLLHIFQPENFSSDLPASLSLPLPNPQTSWEWVPMPLMQSWRRRIVNWPSSTIQTRTQVLKLKKRYHLNMVYLSVFDLMLVAIGISPQERNMKFVRPETASEMMYFTLHFATYTNYADYDHPGVSLSMTHSGNWTRRHRHYAKNWFHAYDHEIWGGSVVYLNRKSQRSTQLTSFVEEPVRVFSCDMAFLISWLLPKFCLTISLRGWNLASLHS